MKAKRTIARLDDLRLLADPTKFRIYEALRETPASPHQLARRFRRKPTALYHHFARLERAALIEVAETRQRRGAVERLYRVTASYLVVDRALARRTRGGRSVKGVLAMAATILQVTAEDIRAASFAPSQPIADTARSELATMTARVTPTQARQLVAKLRALFALAVRYDGSGNQRVRLTLGAIPLA